MQPTRRGMLQRRLAVARERERGGRVHAPLRRGVQQQLEGDQVLGLMSPLRAQVDSGEAAGAQGGAQGGAAHELHERVGEAVLGDAVAAIAVAAIVVAAAIVAATTEQDAATPCAPSAKRICCPTRGGARHLPQMHRRLDHMKHALRRGHLLCQLLLPP